MSRQYDSTVPSSEDPSPRSTTTRSSSRPRPDSTAPNQEASVVSVRPSPSPHSPLGVSSSSEGYPSWLPKRPPPPAPRSTLQSSVAGMFTEAGPSSEPFIGGRKPTPRSVRIVSLQDSSQAEKESRTRQPTEQSRAFSGPSHARVWSRATSAGLTPTLLSSGLGAPFPRPKFRSTGLHPEILRSPSWKKRLLFLLFPLFVLFHIPLQTFFDFNAVFILILVAKYPNPVAPGVPGSGRNWALGAAAYVACWFTWIFVVFIVYELIYSFYRRWRVKRPLMFPIYLSSPAFNFVSMSSYTNFCFMYHIRLSAFTGEHGALRDGLAETAFYYSQNWPTVALLLPRAALSLALLLEFWTAQPGAIALTDAGISPRDGTFFRASDGTLTNYARGVLIANAAWTAWRILVLLLSMIGLWISSGQGCAGLCGPRYRWEEEDVEKTLVAVGDNISDMDALPWSWKECTLLRVKDAHDFCLTIKVRRSSPGVNKGADSREPSVPIEGMERVFAAVGLPSGYHPARRGILSGELFESPLVPDEGNEGEVEVEVEKVVESKSAPELLDVEQPPAVIRSREKLGAGPSGPLMQLPYPFTGYGAQVSSEESVPFPPSPDPEEEREVPIQSAGEDEEEEEEEEEEDEEEEAEESEERSDRRTSGSMSSLGRPIVSRYPFQFRRPTRGSASSASHMSPGTHSTPHSTQSRSTQSHSVMSQSTYLSRSTQSTGNRESSDSPMSNGSSNAPSPLSSSFSGSVIPMPPRHPQVHRRARAGTVPAVPSSPGSPSPNNYPAGRPRARTRTQSVVTESSMTFGPVPPPVFDSDADLGHDDSLMDVPEAEGSIEEAEQHDSVGLLSAGPSPRTSLANLRRRGSGVSHRRAQGSRSRSTTGSGSRSNSRSRTNSSTSRSESARSRAQSLIQSIGAASRSSVDLVRSRANSMVRLSDSPFDSSASDAVLSSPENHTFGHPLRDQWRAEEAEQRAKESAASLDVPPLEPVPEISVIEGSPRLRPMPSTLSADAPSTHAPSERLSEHSTLMEATERIGVPIPGRLPVASDSQPDISTANQSYVTAPATIEGRTDSSRETPSSWGGMEQYPGGALRPV
ncbi:uncharacterized protein FIBRA_00004 [Fibroporia radiculosa]|uniref:Uncharacterized protein n=1 Tax=Fibroporia radiculosa TaxID=599839 RepID=J7SBP7_9APHY|nr:uncharacterized protein FIBRA_00004 [Fibroporia radiculosa]CCL98011.1 predicted protein [Fibroporia radiculosa]